MKQLTHHLLILFILTGCATKYIVPGNRFITPETNGGTLKGQIEVMQASVQELKINGATGTVDGVIYEEQKRTGFMYSNSFFDSFDLFWSHIGSSNSLLGAKVQFLGAPTGAGHKMAGSFAFGGNEHETDDGVLDFKLSGQEIFLLYGYRIADYVMPYAGLGRLSYDYDGKINKGNLAGQKARFETEVWALNTGVEFNASGFLAKLEAAYQQLTTTDSKDKTQFVFGWSVGYGW